MFFVSNGWINYPSKLFIEDLLSRNGESNDDSFTPFSGEQYQIREQFKGSSKFSLSDFLNYSQNMDLNPRRINKDHSLYLDDEEYDADSIEDELVKENAGFVYLEDIDSQEYITRYIKQLLIGYKCNANTEYRKLNSVKSTYRYSDDESNHTVSEAEMIPVEEKRLDILFDVKERLPFILRSLDEGSNYYGFHLFSFIRAYKIITDAGEDPMESRNWIDKETYLYRRPNRVLDRVIHAQDNKMRYYPEARKWACGCGEYINCRYRKYALELLSICEMVGVSIAEESPATFTHSLCSRIRCTYLHSNIEYIDTFGLVDPTILEMIKPENLLSYKNQFKLSSEKEEACKTIDELEYMSIASTYIRTQLKVNSTSKQAKDFLRSGEEACNALFTYLKPDAKLYKDYTIIDDFLFYNGKYRRINISTFIGRKGQEIYGTIHKSGIVVILFPTFTKLYYMTCEELLNRMKGSGGTSVETL